MSVRISHSRPVVAVLLVLLAACSPGDGAYYDAPAAGPGGAVTVPSGTTTSKIATDLRELGLTVTRLTSSTVDASGPGAALLDCGEITQYRNGNASSFPGTSPIAVIYTDPGSLDFYSREVEARSRVIVDLAGNRATVRERHDVTMSWTQSDGSGASRETNAVLPGRTTSFADATTCATNGRVLQALGG